MKKLKGNVKWIMAALVAVIIGASGITLTAVMVQGKLRQGSRHEEKAKYRSSIQVPDDKNEREESEEVEGSEENEASEASEANE
jgi:cytoskeletal protein RodZ